CLQGYSPTYSF
nr:immunoglobulin light chain junction region [Macaca mulatta]